MRVFLSSWSDNYEHLKDILVELQQYLQVLVHTRPYCGRQHVFSSKAL